MLTQRQPNFSFGMNHQPYNYHGFSCPSLPDGLVHPSPVRAKGGRQYLQVTVQNNRLLPRVQTDQMSTQANTPEGSDLDEREYRGDSFGPQSCMSFDGPDSPTNFEIDVKPKKKTFQTQEEKQRFVQDYSRKLKTEMCKNWETKGTCKFGDRCSFAHGQHELKDKLHLHSNYKTKPCKKYFLKGYCSYGHRCQYLHRELLRRPEFREFAAKVYAEKKLYLPPILEKFSEDEAVLTRFQELHTKISKEDWFAQENLKKQRSNNTQQRERLPIFQTIAPEDNTPFEFDPSRPISVNAFSEEFDIFLTEREE